MTVQDRSRAVWRRSSYSSSTGGNCVEVARVDAARLVRDSKNPHGATLTFDTRVWKALVTQIKSGQADL
jgi:hypothetical protein